MLTKRGEISNMDTVVFDHWGVTYRTRVTLDFVHFLVKGGNRGFFLNLFFFYGEHYVKRPVVFGLYL